MTHCHDNEYGEPEEQKPIGGAPDVAGEMERVRRRTCPRAAHCGAKHGGRWLTSGLNDARGMTAVRAAQ